jgi:hypothetical protein
MATRRVRGVGGTTTSRNRAVDRAMVAWTVQELRRALPEDGHQLAGLLRVAEASRTVLEVDGAGLTLVHADGPPRWVAATDAAMDLLAQVQHDFGEGPYLQAYTRTGRSWSRISGPRPSGSGLPPWSASCACSRS